MRYIKQQIKNFTYTNLTDDYPEWNPNTTYVLEEDDTNLTSASVVLYNGYYYRSVVRENKGLNPEEYDGIKWVKYRVSNKHALLDMSSQARSSFDGDMIIEFSQGLIQTLAIGKYTAENFIVQVFDNSNTEIYKYESDSTLNSGVFDWWTYIYAPITHSMDRAMMLNIPVRGSKIRVTFNGRFAGDTTSCGYLVGGQAVDMGYTLMGVRFSYQSYSIKEFDSFGAVRIDKRAVQEILDFETIIKTPDIIRLRYEIKQVYDEIVVFILDERDDSPYDNLMTFGIIQDSSMVMDNGVESTLSFSVVEVV